jgi:putative FmdB family regulatory protein
LPTYEYKCNSCKAVYDLRQGFDAETTHTCEECGKGIAKRVLHAPPVVFKGGGWYATDSRNTKSAMTDSDTTADSGASSETKSESSKKTDSKASKSDTKSTTTESAAGA